MKDIPSLLWVRNAEAGHRFHPIWHDIPYRLVSPPRLRRWPQARIRVKSANCWSFWQSVEREGKFALALTATVVVNRYVPSTEMLAFGASCRNLLLRALPPSHFDALRPHLTRVPLEAGHVIVGKNEPISFVCFPEDGVTSISEVLDDGTRVGLGMIGRDGMTNSSLLLGCELSPHEAVVEIGGGTSLRLEADQLRAFCANSAPANALFLRFVHTLGVQMGTTAAFNLRDASATRLARWLLMCHDRVDGDDLCLRHAHIARLLGVRRATVTDMLHVLEGAGAIKNARGHIVVRDRVSLRAIAGESYGYAEQQYRILVGPSGDRSRGRSLRIELIPAE